MYESRDWYNDKVVQITMSNLNKNGFTTLCASSKEEAKKKVLEIIPKSAKVGVGGSVTIRELSLIKALEERGNTVFNHWRSGLTKEETKKIRRSQLISDIFVSSSNAVTMDGKLVNIDGIGNRVASIIFGPSKVIIVAGVNKIVKDVNEGINRIRNIATPMNAHRLGYNSPCSHTGICVEEECEPPERLCNIITIIERRPNETDLIVVLVREKLGY